MRAAVSPATPPPTTTVDALVSTASAVPLNSSTWPMACGLVSPCKASSNPGSSVCKGCTRTGHWSMATMSWLATARTLVNMKSQWSGTLMFVAQPAEETVSGAKAMLADGLFTRFPMEAVFGMHNWPNMKAGQFAINAGPCFASSNEFRVTVIGKGCHAAMPHLGLDPMPVACQLVQAFQTILTRSKRPLDAAVLSITQVQAGGSVINVIPDSAWLGGSVRAYSTGVVDLIERRMNEIAGSIAAAHGCEAEVFFERRYPALVNTAAETEFCMEVMREVAGEDHARVIEPAMASEDFAFLLQEKPGCYVFLGNGDGEHRMAGHGLGPCMLHNASYDFNDALIPAGASYWIRLAQRYLA